VPFESQGGQHDIDGLGFDGRDAYRVFGHSKDLSFNHVTVVGVVPVTVAVRVTGMPSAPVLGLTAVKSTVLTVGLFCVLLGGAVSAKPTVPVVSGGVMPYVQAGDSGTVVV